MKLEQQVCSLELAQRLKELQVPQKSIFRWNTSSGVEDRLEYIPEFCNKSMELVSAFTVAELGEMLPKSFRSGKSGNQKSGKFKAYGFSCFDSHCNGVNSADGQKHTRQCFNEDTEADARAKMLIYLLENKLITL